MRKITIVLLLAFLALSLPACGGEGGSGGGETFDGDGYAFTYPASWEELDAGEASPDAVLLSAFGPGEGLDALVFEVFEGGPVVDESNIDTFAANLAASIRETTEGPTRLTVAGLPALRILAHPEADRRRRVTTVFDGGAMYIFDCGYAVARAAEMLEGCDLIEESFEID